jgi:serine/threonine protein kinase
MIDHFKCGHTENKMCIVFDMYATTVHALMHHFKVPFSFNSVKIMARQLIEGVAYIHEQGFIHTGSYFTLSFFSVHIHKLFYYM